MVKNVPELTTQLSRDDPQRFLSGRVPCGIIETNSFQQIDESGIDALVDLGIINIRAAGSDATIGVCGDPASIAFFNSLSIDYVSCSPFRVPVSRLAAAHPALGRKRSPTEGQRGVASKTPTLMVAVGE